MGLEESCESMEGCTVRQCTISALVRLGDSGGSIQRVAGPMHQCTIGAMEGLVNLLNL